MPLTDKCSRVAISKIIVDRETRQRRIIDTDGLEASIARIGLLQPIVIDQGFNLKAGERRLTACINLGHKDILARFVKDLTPIEASIIELEENIKRSDLDWPDLVQAVVKIHGLYLQSDEGWTLGETAQALSLTIGTISMYLRVGNALAEQRIADAGTVREAYNMLSRREQRAAGDALQALLEDDGEDAGNVPVNGRQTGVHGDPDPSADPGTPHPSRPSAAILPASETILTRSFLDWAPGYSGVKFNLVHCDFPYGVDLMAGPQGRGAEPPQDTTLDSHAPDGEKKWTVGYDDANRIYWELIECLCSNMNRIMSVSAHLMFWCSADHSRIAKTTALFAKLAPSLKFHRFPLIWIKSDNAGIASDPTHGPRHIYETCLLASRGARQIVRIVSDAYSAPTDKKLHPSCKPEPMLRHFMTMLVDETSLVLDPTCGSGAALRAAESLNAKHTLGLEFDQNYADLARQALHNFRLLRTATKAAS